MARKIGSSGAETAQRLRDVALELFARDGYAAVSMRTIAAKAGVQAGAIYNHFPTKQDILRELLSIHMNTLLAAWSKANCRGTDPARKLEEFIRFHVRYHFKRQREIFISYMELRNLDAENFVEIRALRRKYEAIPRTMIEAGIADGSFAVGDARITTLAILATLNGLTTWYKEGGRLSLAEIENLYVGLVAGMVGAQKELEHV